MPRLGVVVGVDTLVGCLQNAYPRKIVSDCSMFLEDKVVLTMR
jgi:hypothetical protein